MGGSDCELLRDGWLAQPANAWSSAAYLLAAVHVVVGRRSTDGPAHAGLPVVGAVAIALVGLGSFAYHGPQPAWASALHDGSIAALLVVLAARSLAEVRGRPLRPGTVVGAGALVAVAAAVVGPLFVHGPLVVVVAGAEVLRGRRGGRGQAHVLAVVALGSAVALAVLGRTGGPLCDPGSVLQAHAGWHALTAVAVAASWRRQVPEGAPGAAATAV